MEFLLNTCCQHIINKLDNNQKEIRSLYCEEKDIIKKEKLKQLYDDSYNDYFNSLLSLENMIQLI